jgi:PAS domain S-box-containing protein
MKPDFFPKLLPPLTIVDDYRGVVAKFLNAMLVTLITLLSILWIGRLALDRAMDTPQQTLAVLIIFYFVLLVALRRGHVLTAGIATVLSTWAVVTYLVWSVEGIYDVVIVGYIIVIVMASVLTNSRIQVFVTAISVLSVWGLAFYHPNSVLKRHDSPVNFARDLTIFFTLAGILTFFLVRTLRRSMTQTRDELNERKIVEARLRSIVENTTDFILEIDRSEQILFINKNTEQYIGKHVRDVLPPDQYQLARETMEKVFQTGEPFAIELQTITPEGTISWDSIRLGPIMTGNEVTSLTVIMTEITERKNYEQERESLIAELQARNAELTQFAYTVSHELKTPIVTMKGFVGSIGHDLKSKKYERAEKDLLRVSTAIDKLHNTLSDLLELSRIGRMMNLPRNIPFGDIIKDALEIVQGQLEKYKVSVQIQPNLPTVHGDRQRLTEALQNLIDNAAKYMGDQSDPLIEIGQSGEEDEKPVFFVKDNGMGIAPEYHERIFGLFNKLDAKSEGTGVGLALVKRIIEFHGGRIWVESELDKGSTFYFTLPRG